MPYKDPEKRRAYQRVWEQQHYKKHAAAICAHKRRWRAAHKDKGSHYERKSNLKRKFGLTVEQYDELLRQQNGVCKICFKINPDESRLAVDHNHITGEIRGLLCINCNKGIGHFMDNIALLEEAKRYVETASTGYIVPRG